MSSSDLVERFPGVWAHPSAILDEPVNIGPGTRVWHFCHLMSGATIGAAVNLGQNCFVASSAVIGARVKVQNNVSLYDGVVLEDDVFVGPSAVFTNVRTPRAHVPRRHEYATTRVLRGATIGANASVLPGVTVGAYAFVGAGAVVTHDIPDHALAIGAPARCTGWVSRRGVRLVLDARGRGRCPESGELYVLSGDRLVLEEG